MKRMIYIITGLLLLFSLTGAAQTDPAYFYYHKGKKIPLQLNEEYVYVLMQPDKVKSKKDLVERLGKQFEVTHFSERNAARLLNTEAGNATSSREYRAEVKLNDKTPYDAQVKRLEALPYITLVTPCFTSGTGGKTGLTDHFNVKLKKAADLGLLQQAAKDAGVEIAGQNKYMPLWYTLKCTGDTQKNALEAANRLYESGDFEAVEPSLLLEAQLNSLASRTAGRLSGTPDGGAPGPVSNDSLFKDQWGLKNTGQYQSPGIEFDISGIDIKAEEAWAITTGAGVTVAVHDTGVELDHPDLKANVSGPGYNTQTGTGSVVTGDHGTNCAGVIGAVQDNGIGLSGVAPNAKITSISGVGSGMSDVTLANGFTWAADNGVDIISNSWKINIASPLTLVDNAIEYALTQGRDGLGTVVVFASGRENGPVSYPANANADIIVVGGMSFCGGRLRLNSCDLTEGGSSFGSELDVMAPGVYIPTTDLQGAAGIDAGDYFKYFGGTSSAAPHVAGVAALVLSVNPNLTAKQVADIIEQTAVKMHSDDPYKYATDAGHPNGTWNNEMGYGLVNAYEAVKLAQTITTDPMVDPTPVDPVDPTVDPIDPVDPPADNCPETLVVDQNVAGGAGDNRQAATALTAVNVVANTAAADYKAGGEVVLEPGFDAQKGADFHGYIEACAATTGPLPVHAAFYRGDYKAYYFHGDECSRYDEATDKGDAGFPAKISEHFPGLTPDIDAAVNWGNGTAWFFKGDQCIRFDIGAHKIDAGFPAKISDHFNLPASFSSDIDAVANLNGKAWFFKGDQVLRYDIAGNKVDAGFPKKISEQWPGFSPSRVDAAVYIEDPQIEMAIVGLFEGNVLTFGFDKN